MKQIRIIILLAIFCLPLSAQIHLKGIHQERIHSSLFRDEWKAYWIAVSDESINEYGVYHFRKTLVLDSIPSCYIVHVSADNRYKLYVNEQLVSLGPVRGDVYNWNFETLDLAPYLKAGKNVLAAAVWNYAEHKPIAQMSKEQTGFIVQGNTTQEQAVNTDNTWKCIKNRAYSPCESGQVMGYYVAGPGEKVDMKEYPWGWEQLEYDDSLWKSARVGMHGAMKGARDYSGRLLVPSPIPAMEMKQERLAEVRKCEGVKLPEAFLKKPVSLVVSPHSSVHLLLDNEKMTTGYLSVLLSGGRNAEITISYAEALYDSCPDDSSYSMAKGNRDEIEGKCFWGYEDKLIADGGKDRCHTSLWWRTWRYVDIRIKTADEALVLNDVYGTFTAYPFERSSSFTAGGYDDLERMLDIGWRTARLCANETYMDCPYYEQLQYFGDTRIQTMVTMYNTKDTCMVKHAIEQGRRSVTAEGITMSRYPSNSPQFISSYSLCWIGMGYDYWMYREDAGYIKSLLPVFRSILSWYEQWLKPDYSLGYVPYWFFADWAAGFPNGEPIREEHGNSAFQDLRYIVTLEEAASMEQDLGMLAMAQHYRDIADKIRRTIRTKYWDEERKMFADTHDHRSFSQHVNTFAVLAGVVTDDEARGLFIRMLTDKSLAQATIYFRYYVHQAMDKVGSGDLLLDNLSVWHDQMMLGLTTWAETPEPSRSDCHAWGASLNIDFFRMILGIRSGAPGFKKVVIKPSLGELKNVSGSIPHPMGEIAVSYCMDKKMKAKISLPKGVTGVFIWKEKEYLLKPGVQTINIKSGEYED